MASHALHPLPLLTVLLASAAFPAAAESPAVDARRLPEARAPPPRAGGTVAPEGAEGRQGPPRVPEDLLGPARPQPRHGGQRVRRRRPSRLEARRRALLVPEPEGRRDRLRPGAPAPGSARGAPGTGELTGQTTGARFDNQAFTREGSRAGGDLDLPRPARATVHVHASGASHRLRHRVPLRGGRHRGPGPARARRRRTWSGPRSATAADPTAASCRSRPSAGTAAGALDLLTTPRVRLRPRRRDEARHARAEGRGVRGGPRAVPRPPRRATRRPERVSLAVRATGANGPDRGERARGTASSAGRRRLLVASWALSLKPGRYQVTVAGFRPETAQGGTTALDVEVPDFGGGALAASPLVLYPDEPPAEGAADPRDPYAAFRLGPARLRPRFGNVFAPQDALDGRGHALRRQGRPGHGPGLPPLALHHPQGRQAGRARGGGRVHDTGRGRLGGSRSRSRPTRRASTSSAST